MIDEAAFLRAVIADPDDDAPRLIYADWLDEHGQSERAEFIRVQCEVARLNDVDRRCPDLDNYGRSSPRWKEGICQCRGCVLRRRERELLGTHFGEWTNGLPEPFVTRQCPYCEDGVADYETNVIECSRCDCTGLLPDDEKVEFRRGFVESVTCAAADWLAHADALLVAQPVQEVRLTTSLDPNAVAYHLQEEWLKRHWPYVKNWNLPPTERVLIQGANDYMRDVNSLAISVNEVRALRGVR